MDALRINNQEFDVETAQKMIDAGLLGAGQKHDTSSATPSMTPLNGPFPGNNAQFGIFSGAGINTGVWNATPRVESIGRYIPLYKSQFMQELVEVATGVTVGSGSNVTSACTVGPKPGQLKGMRISAQFGIIHASTKIGDVTQAGMLRNRADVPREFYNTASVDNPWLPQVPGIDGAMGMASVMRAEFLAMGIDLERGVSQVHFKGIEGVEDNTYRGVARQWNGLDRMVRNDWTDVSGVAVPAASAAVINFNAAGDGGTTTDGRTFVGATIDTYFGQVDYLNRIGIAPVYALVMRPDQFRAIAALWSCSYSTTRCVSSSAGQPLVRDAVSVRSEYEAMMAGRYLPMEGTNVPVIFDNSIERTTLGNGYYNADIYGVMLSGNGVPTLYGEYFDMDNPEATELANFIASGNMSTVNNGMYRVFKRETGGCIEYDFFARPRLITTTPFAHFRIDNVFYRSGYDQRDAVPGMSYYANGGVTFRS